MALCNETQKILQLFNVFSYNGSYEVSQISAQRMALLRYVHEVVMSSM